MNVLASRWIFADFSEIRQGAYNFCSPRIHLEIIIHIDETLSNVTLNWIEQIQYVWFF